MEVKDRNIINVLLLLLGFTLFQVGSSSTEGPVSTLEKFTVPPTTVVPSTSTTKTTTTTTKTTTNGSRTTKAAEKDYVGVGVGVAVGGFFVLVAAILLICYFFCSPCKKFRNDEPDGLKLHSMLEEELIKDFPQRQPKPVPVADLPNLLKLRRKNKHEFQEEFKSLPPPNRPRLKSCSEAAMHPSKNRYSDILPYNEDRVKLKMASEDYINASYIDGFEKKNEFIATQGPLGETCDHFWMMLWEQKSDKIIMLTKVLEDGMPKCAVYFPCKDLEGIAAKVMTFKNISVSVLKEENYQEYVVREFNVQKGNEKRVVTQYHFTDWPDKGVPDTCTSMLRFRDACLGNTTPHENPVIIHCSAGVGRTGTLLATDILLRQAQRSGVVDVPLCVDHMRRSRICMVQSLSQYIYTYHAVAEGLLLGEVSLSREAFLHKCQQLDAPASPLLPLQFQLLESAKPHFNEHSFSSGMNHREHNRFSKILPMDDFMPALGTQRDQYINAVHLVGFKGHRDIIVTQSPLPKDFETFWKMVKEHHCYVVVMLNDLLEHEPKYWPDDGQVQRYGQMAVMNAGEISSEDIVASDFNVSCLSPQTEGGVTSSSQTNEGYNSDSSEDSVKERLRKDSSSFHVRHFRLIGWDEKHYPKDKIGSLLSLTAEVKRCLQRVPEGSLLVHCLNGADKSGLFSALLNVLFKLESVAEVDVHNAVKLVQRRRTEFVNSQEQLKYLYDILHQYVSTTRPT